MHSQRLINHCLIISVFAALIVLADDTALADEHVDYLKHIKPVLAERCFACHGALKQEAGLRLDTAALAIKGGESGPAIMPGKAAESLLIQRVTSTDESERMPGEGQPLKPDQIAVLKAWIDQNAKAPADEQAERDPRDHWSFRPIVRPPVPQIASSAWVRNPIDAFVAERHEQLGLTPQAEAPRAVLVRRLCLDLVGLPPTTEELTSVDADTTDDWYEHFVKRLLADPRHGERWARHWMDIWRYSDWWGLGDQLRNSQYHIWHWRDWIVESLNANVPYDEMVRQMLAADELYPNDASKLRATGYLARNWSLLIRNLWMEETVEHVSKGFLGLTMNCAKCHNHKFDPIAQADFYRMRAFFEPYQVRLDLVPGETNLGRDGIPRVFDGRLDLPTYRFERGLENQADKSKVIEPGVPELLAFDNLEIHPVALPKAAWQPERRPHVLETYLTEAKKSLERAEASLAPARKKLESAQKTLREIAENVSLEVRRSAETAVVDTQAEFHAAYLASEAAPLELSSVQLRAAATRAAWAKEDDTTGNPKLAEAARSATTEAVKVERKAAVANGLHAVADIELKIRRAAAAQKATLEVGLTTARESLAKAEQNAVAALGPDDKYTPLVGAKWTPTRFIISIKDDPEVKFPDHSTGRRTALAVWLTDRRNPLTARVAVNHLWARHMGTPLVATVFNFGRSGTPPTHPELLDWLASELIDSGWDMKHMHRLIVMSSAYRMSSSTARSDANLAKDADNLHLWHRAPIRLESQTVRDSILALAGKLDLTRGGPTVPPDAQTDSTRRSLYFFHSNNERNLFLMTFDEASVNECYRREQSIIPQQALALSNSRLVHDAARPIADRLSQSTTTAPPPSNDDEFIQKAYSLILGVPANDAEVAASKKALEAWRKLPEAAAKGTADLAREHLVWALLNHTDFVTVR